MPFSVVSGIGLGMGVLDFGRRGRGSLGWIQCRNDVLIDYRLVCEKLAVFPYTRYTVEFCIKFPLSRYSEVQDQIVVEEKFMCKNVAKQTQHVHCDISDNAPLRGGHMHDLDLTVNMLGPCDPSNFYSLYPPRSGALFSNYFEDLFVRHAGGSWGRTIVLSCWIPLMPVVMFVAASCGITPKLRPPLRPCTSPFCGTCTSSLGNEKLLRHVSQRVGLIVIPGCLFVCLPVIRRPTAYHDWSITTKFGMQVNTSPRTRVSLFGSAVSHTLGSRWKNMENFSYFQL